MLGEKLKSVVLIKMMSLPIVNHIYFSYRICIRINAVLVFSEMTYFAYACCFDGLHNLKFGLNCATCAVLSQLF